MRQIPRPTMPIARKDCSMLSRSRRLMIATALTLAALGVAVAPASATITPVNGNIDGSAGRNQVIARSGLAALCTTSTFNGRVSSDGRSASGNVDFSNAGRTTCLGTFGVSCEVRSSDSRNTITLRSTASTAGTSATGDLVLDSDFTYAISCLGGGLLCTISGPQTLRGAWSISQRSPPTLTIDAIGVACGEGRTLTQFEADYSIVQRITIS
jgi:hypothetical protein